MSNRVVEGGKRDAFDSNLREKMRDCRAELDGVPYFM
jgi:hypothetical protein